MSIRKVRKGITPVVAVVLLLLITVGTVATAWAWINGFIGDQQERTAEKLNTQVEFRDLVCNSGDDSVEFYVKNTGSTAVTSTSVEAYVYNVSDGALVSSVDVTSAFTNSMDPDDDVDSNFTVSGGLTPGLQYEVRVEFSDHNNYIITDTCQAQ
ncbi:MAG: hypothetical protein MUP58_03850 [Candidatus Nanohaloarchaeota archaeon QJJ-9]|nr:hypothetical protein [Candidatus Nanohaloarchaeota archaeon QJJ-9]